jgi:hypothetical protein
VEAGFYGVAALGSPMGAGVTGSREARLDGVVKTWDPAAPYTVANEYICGRLASAVGLPVPPGTIARLNDGSWGYVMLRFGHRGDRLPPVDPPEVVRYKASLAAGVVAFDSWVINFDRHEGNLAYAQDVGLSVFDHGHALLGTTDAGAINHMEMFIDKPVISGCLVPHLQEPRHLHQWAHRLSVVPDDLVGEVCDTAGRLDIITRAEAKAVTTMLNARKVRLWDDIRKNEPLFTGISDWGLL